MVDLNRMGFAPKKTDHLLTPVDILGFEAGHVRLRPSDMPAQFQERTALGIFFPFDDQNMFVPRDGPFFPFDDQNMFVPRDGPFFLVPHGRHWRLASSGQGSQPMSKTKL